MIVFDLRCTGGHVFEAWFGSSAAYERQRADGHLACPVCGTGAVDKALMAPAIAAKGNRATPPAHLPDRLPAPLPDRPVGEGRDPAAVKAAMRAIAAAQAAALASSEWVGTAFAGRARAMHAGDEPQATIHGQATLADARALAAEGVPIAALPMPVVPPGQVN